FGRGRKRVRGGNLSHDRLSFLLNRGISTLSDLTLGRLALVARRREGNSRISAIGGGVLLTAMPIVMPPQLPTPRGDEQIEAARIGKLVGLWSLFRIADGGIGKGLLCPFAGRSDGTK